jgi:V/A-type H+-transporting ATPase subunit I
MIVKMAKAYVVSHAADRERLLEALRELGVVHLMPIDPAQAVATEETLAAIDRLHRAIQVLGQLTATGEKLDLTATEAAAETLEIQRRAAERRSRLSALHRQINQLSAWGDATLGQFEQLRQAGIEVGVYSVPTVAVAEIQAECVSVVGEVAGRRSLVAIVSRDGEPQVPESAEPIDLPARDRPSLRAEAAEIDEGLRADAKQLEALAHFVDGMAAQRDELREQAQFTVADRGGMSSEDLYAVQGWVPAADAEALAAGLAESGVAAGVQTIEPAADEAPPTLVRYPRWAQPIKGLFDVLGTVPGYREIEVSGFFMIALPVFAAMLIGDAGYGLLFVLVPAIKYRKAIAAAGKPGVHLLIVMGIATIIWGALAGVYFGVTPQQMINTGGVVGGIGKALNACQVIRGDVKQQAYLIMKISFVMAAIHLCLAQLRQALDVAPRLEMLSKIGWAVFLWGIFFVIWYLFFQSKAGRPPHWLTPYLLIVGAALAILFASPSRNPLKMVGLGLAEFPLNALGAFSDSISYIRLMGVGLASTIIGQTFNSLGVGVASAGTWLAGGIVVLFGHGLNIAMCMIAILAHGVRLNMLEFSNNAGVQWAGYAYEPFAKGRVKEQ